MARRAKPLPLYDVELGLSASKAIFARIEPRLDILRVYPDPSQDRLDLASVCFLATNLIFCCIMSLKLTMLIHGQKVTSSHDIRKIFYFLPDDARATISQNYATFSTEDRLPPGSRSIRLQIGSNDGINNLPPIESRPVEASVTIKRLLVDTGDSFQTWRFLLSDNRSDPFEITFHHVGLRLLLVTLNDLLERYLNMAERA